MKDNANSIDYLCLDPFDQLINTDAVPKLTQICRSCLSETNESDQQLGTTMILFNNPQEIRSLLEESTGVQIVDSDFLPNHICDKCLKTLRAWYKFRAHTQRSNEILQKYLKKLSTSLDNKTFPSTDIAIHLHGEKMDVVPKQDVKIEDFQITVVNEKPEVVGFVFHCESCPMTFTNQVDLNKHKEEHITTKQKAFKCKLCPRSFAFRNGLHNHTELYHNYSQSHKFQCDRCEKIFKNPGEFRSHKNKKCVPLALIEQCKIRPLNVSMEELLIISEKVIRETKISCSLCKENFKTYDELVRHFPKHNKNRDCPICQKKFQRVVILEKHVRMHLHLGVFSCPICSRLFYSSKAFRIHIHDHGKREWVYRCNVCSKDFFIVREFETHMLKHLKAVEDEKKALDITAVDDEIENDDNFEIDNECELNTSDEDENDVTKIESAYKMERDIPNFQDPFKSVKEEEEKDEEDIERSSPNKYNKNTPVNIKIDFPIDTSVIDSKKELKFIKTESQIYSGSEIDADYESSNQAYQIQNETTNQFYTNDKNVKAEISDLEDIVKLEEEDEDNAHNTDDEKPELDNCSSSEEEKGKEGDYNVNGNDSKKQPDEYMQKLLDECKVACHVAGCQTKHSNLPDMWIHFSTKHLPERMPYKCSMCFQKFNNRSSIRSHIKKYYSFKCPVCHKTKSSSELRKHVMLTHSTDRPFKCSICDKTFARAAVFKVHETTHSDKKEFNCSVCCKSFFSYNGLRKHLKKNHMVIKELQCLICSKQFSTKSHLKRHSKTCEKK